MRDFEYEAPATLADAVALLGQHNGKARPLAGGTDLIDQVRIGRLEPDVVIDIKRIPELNRLECSVHGLRVGAATPCYKIYGNPAVNEHFTALSESCRIIGGVQIQSRASVGGNLCNSGPAADSTPSLIALNATCVIAGPKGTREVPVEQFCTGPGKNLLQPGELLVELKCPAPPARSGSHYRRFIPRNEMDIAVVGVGVAVTLDASGQKFSAARISLGAVAATPLFASEASASLVGQAVNDDSIRRAAELAKKIAQPIDDMRGTVEYRIHLVGVLVERALQTAISRARGEKAHYKPGH